MPKNILIFSDGTGQVGGIRFDETRTNIYKMYRAMRCGPDSTVDPGKQVAFYDPGIGSLADGGNLFGRIVRAVYNLIAQATGFGITRNIIDCYAAAIQLWEPGDRIYLFGFSRGAYTARCVAEVISLCGIPRIADTKPLKLNAVSARKLASYAVKHIYQFTAPRPPGKAHGKQAYLEETRQDLAANFRANHTARRDGEKGTFPYFVGVFDTVAALVNPVELAALAVSAAALIGIISGIVAFATSPFGDRAVTFWDAFLSITLVSAILTLAAYIWTHFKVEYGAGIQEAWKTWHFTDAWPKFYDDSLDPHIAYAKHAISIDENRKAFQRVRWSPRSPRHAEETDTTGLPWFEQLWFAGNHADIGGGYPEAESRLSDITLDWMLRCACEVPGDLQFDKSVLRRWPSPAGPQHDQVAEGFGLFTTLSKVSWPKGERTLPRAGKIIVHQTVYDRFECGPVLHCDGRRPYRPTPLTTYPDVAAFYSPDAPSDQKAKRDSLARAPRDISE